MDDGAQAAIDDSIDERGAGSPASLRRANAAADTASPSSSQERALPYLQAALLCDRVLVEQDGTVSVMRTIDRFTFTIPASEATEPLPPIPLRCWLLAVIRSGGTGGRFDFRLDIVAPSGRRRDSAAIPFDIDGSSPGNGGN